MPAGCPGLNKPFDAYAAYYDLLYRQKDYAAEAAYVDRSIRRYQPYAGSLLELGSGTGGHAVHFSRMGYDVHGIDLSPAMVSLAKDRAGRDDAQAPTFEVADLRTFRAPRLFDAVVSLFHVMSYQVDDDDFRAALATASAHLVPGGVFVFDCWYGPAVLADPPRVRTRTLSGGAFSVFRKAYPDHDPVHRRVDVRFEIDVRNGDSRERIDELHPMRYFFRDEVEAFLEDAGLHTLEARAWLEESDPDTSSWYASFVAQKPVD